MKKLLFVYFLAGDWLWHKKPFEPLALANDLLNSLTADQKEVVSFALEDPAKTRWHYLPHDSFTREGLPLSEMSLKQIDKTYNLLKNYLSESGYHQMQQIIDLENYLAVVENNPKKGPQKVLYRLLWDSTPRFSLGLVL